MIDPNTPATAQGDCNPDPITGEPGSHPIGTGVGAAGAGTAGAAIGAAVGPVGAIIGAAVGAVVGGLAGKGVAESIDPTVHEAYWKQNHSLQPYANQASYDRYNQAYRTGYEGVGQHGVEKDYSSVESHLEASYEKTKDNVAVAWDDAKHATRAAYEHARDEVKSKV